MKTPYYCEDIQEICDHNHLTVDEIFTNLQEKYPDAGRSSVYRNVEQMVERGDLRKVTGIGKKAFFEKNNGDHIHIIDSVSGEIHDVNPECLKGLCLPK